MAKYVDGFVIPIKKNKLAEYKKLAKQAAKVWKKYGALEYVEALGDDLNIKGVLSFKKLSKIKRDEVVIFSFITYKSKAHRNLVNAKVMQDPKIQAMCNASMSCFDPKQMAYGGFQIMVNA